MAEAGCPALTLPNQFGEEWWWMPEAVNGNERSLPVIEKCGGSGANQNPYSTRFLLHENRGVSTAPRMWTKMEVLREDLVRCRCSRWSEELAVAAGEGGGRTAAECCCGAVMVRAFRRGGHGGGP